MNVSKISVVIPAFNRAGLIGATLESVLAQSLPPDEVIVVDDGSIDGTPEIAETFGRLVRVIRQTNQGAGAARNRGLSEASGEFVHFMDSDDLSSPNSYADQVKALNLSGADMTYGPWVKTRFAGDKISIQRVVIQQSPVPMTVPLDRWLIRGWVTVLQPCLLRRSLMERVGPYRVDLKPSEDSELLYRIAKSGARLIHTPDTLVLYRVHPAGQVSVANPADRTIDWIRFLLALEKHMVVDASLDLRTRLQFEFRKIEALRALHGEYESTAKQLSGSISSFANGLGFAAIPLRRLMAKIRRWRYGDDYGNAFQVGPMTRSQRHLVGKMGYEIVEDSNACGA